MYQHTLMTFSGSLDFYTKATLFTYLFSLCSYSHFLANCGPPECALLALRGVDTEDMGDVRIHFHTAGTAILSWRGSSSSLHPPLWTFVHVQRYFVVPTGWVVCSWHQKGETRYTAQQPAILRDSTETRVSPPMSLKPWWGLPVIDTPL